MSLYPSTWDLDEREEFSRQIVIGLVTGMILFVIAFLIRPAAVRAILAA